jgi:hypothetical protein
MVEEVAREITGKTAVAIQLALTAAERVAIRQAVAMEKARQRSEAAVVETRRRYQAEAELLAAQWAAAAGATPEWIDGYASAAAWRGLDDRAQRAAETIEAQLRRAGVEIPESATIRDANERTKAAGYEPAEVATSTASVDRDPAAVEQTIGIPAGRENPDRGVAPTKAATSEERAHREAAWAIAERTYIEQHPSSGAEQQWRGLPDRAKYVEYWKAYETAEARMVPTRDREAYARYLSDALDGEAVDSRTAAAEHRGTAADLHEQADREPNAAEAELLEGAAATERDSAAVDEMAAQDAAAGADQERELAAALRDAHEPADRLSLESHPQPAAAQVAVWSGRGARQSKTAGRAPRVQKRRRDRDQNRGR